MNIAAQQRMLYAIAGTCLLGATGAVVWSTAEITPKKIATERHGSGVPATGVDSSVAVTDGDTADLARSLRGPLHDPPPAPPKSAPKVRPTPQPKSSPPSPRLNLTLVGTIIDPARSLAIVADADGNFDVKGVGDSLELTPAGVRIGRIESEAITLEYQGGETTIRLDRELARRPTGGGRQGNNRRRNQ